MAPSDVIWTSPPPGSTSTSLQSALIVDDRRLRAVLDLEFVALYDWNIQTGAIDVRRLPWPGRRLSRMTKADKLSAKGTAWQRS